MVGQVTVEGGVLHALAHPAAGLGRKAQTGGTALRERTCGVAGGQAARQGQGHLMDAQVTRAVPGARQVGQQGRQALSGAQESDGEDERLFQKLRELRMVIAREIGKPPYIVFSDKSLRDMARVRPTTNAQMLGISGVGEVKMQRYGERFLEVIRAMGE